jgi:hypothetical protein
MRGIKSKEKTDNSQSLSKNAKKAFFFLRHNNDIDHITPVLYKWLSTENIPTDVIITTKKEFLKDYRIEYLKQFKNVRIFYINDIFKKYTIPYLFNYFYFKEDTKFDMLFNKFTFIRKLADKAIKRISEKLYNRLEGGIVVFDWTTTYFVRKMVELAKSNSFTTVSLPHGDAPYYNFMIAKNDFDYSCLDSYSKSRIFDYVVVPNMLFFERYKKYLDKDSIKILGSPRYSNEWMKINAKYVPPFNIKESKNKLKIVMFLRSTGFPIFWEEVVRTIILLMQFPEVYLLVKHHPRSAASRKLTDKMMSVYPSLEKKLDKNLKFIYGKENSSSLMNWADIIIDLGTSTTWEAVKNKKPVIMPEYLHANYSTIAYYFKESEIKCRDQLYDIIEKFIKNKDFKFYDEKSRKKFIREVIDVPDEKVLERYALFLKSFF